MTYGVLVPQPEIKSAPLALEVWSLKHWTARKVPFYSSGAERFDNCCFYAPVLVLTNSKLRFKKEVVKMWMPRGEKQCFIIWWIFKVLINSLFSVCFFLVSLPYRLFSPDHIKWFMLNEQKVRPSSCIHLSWWMLSSQLLSYVWLFGTPWNVACQVPLSMEFLRQEYWSGLPFPPPGYLPHPGIEPTSPVFIGGFLTAESLGNSSTVSMVASGQEPWLSRSPYVLL